MFLFYRIAYNILPMRINTLKFTEITTVVNNRELNLDLFDPTNDLFEDTPIKTSLKTNRNVDRYKIGKNKMRSNCIQESKMGRKKQQRSDNNEDVLFHLQQSLLTYMQCISSEEKRSIRTQMQILASVMSEHNSRIVLQQMDQLEGSLSKRIKNRIMHLIFYLVHNQLQAHTLNRSLEYQIRNYLYCEYYSRKFNFKKLALFICIQLQELYCFSNNYEMSRHYARKALRLAVVLANSYYEAKMIECLYILNYYEGRLNQNTASSLSKEQRKRILETYSEDQQCPNIFDLDSLAKFSRKEFSLEHHNNYIENSIPNENIRYFQNNYHDIIKAIPGKNINVRNIMGRVAAVGVIKKYFGRDNYITLKPECHIVKPNYQEQVLITHKKDGGILQKGVSWRKLMKRIRRMLDYTISAFAYQL